MAKTLPSQYRGLGFDPWSGELDATLQLKILRGGGRCVCGNSCVPQPRPGIAK